MTADQFKDALREECESLFLMLTKKNERYGNSALEPLRVFSSADPAEQIRVRIDDKLSRIKTSAPGDDEDAIQDLMGYLLLMRVQERLSGV